MADTDSKAKAWKVVVIDDDADNLGVAERVLQHFGAQVRTARSGDEGKVAIKEMKPTVILLDLSMPFKDGWEVHRELRDDPETMHIPVIALTAHGLSSDRMRIASEGFDGHIVKPFRIHTFIDDIQRCLAALPEDENAAPTSKPAEATASTDSSAPPEAAQSSGSRPKNENE